MLKIFLFTVEETDSGWVTPNQVIREMSLVGLRPVTGHELLSLLASKPELILGGETMYFAALGDQWISHGDTTGFSIQNPNFDDGPNDPYLWIDTMQFDSEYIDTMIFPAVRK